LLFQANLFVLLSVICVLLNLSGFILGHQGIQFVSSAPRCDSVDMGENKICLCCEEFQTTKCSEEAVLKLYHLRSCSFALNHLKKLLFALCVLSAFTTIVCLSVAVLCYLRIFTARGSYLGEAQIEDPAQVLEPEDFIPPVPPPSYFTTFFSHAPPMSCRVFHPNTVLLFCIYRAQIRGADVFSSVDPPPPYEAAQSQNSYEQEDAVQASVSEAVGLGEVSDRQSAQGKEHILKFSSSRVSLSLSNASLLPAGEGRRSFHPLKKRSKSDPVLHCPLPQGEVLGFESETENEANGQLCAVTQCNSLRRKALRGRPQSLVDLTDTKRLAAWVTEQSPCSMSSDILGLVGNSKSVLKPDGKHTAEAATSATFLEQVVLKPCSWMPLLPFQRQPGLLHLESCGDLSTYTTNEDHLAERIQEADHE
ncbi:F1892 protein, partial [Indicator maculatus]|nr:F1892 protein [Indicator maculatus]